ncbi:OmpH family outer membrane protein [Zavarzinia sp. CC-PAN008]|uniref:OmpH family outer membrane protein n=1 Tax=Zavarzinia sp. CC-PAN008 TaxID=3243332 RepID=UPI003F749F9D
MSRIPALPARPHLRSALLAAALALGVGALGAPVLSSPALAQQAAAPASNAPFPRAAIVVVDYEKILNTSTAAADIRRQMQALRQSMQGEIDREEASLRTEEQQLRQQQASLPADQFEQRRQAFIQKVTDAQRRVQSRNARLEQALDTATGKMRQALVPIFSTILEGRGANVLLDTHEVLYSTPTLDITNDVMAQLNRQLTSVKVELPPSQ